MCCICLKIDRVESLTAAGTYHASTQKTDSLHVQNLTQKWKIMAAATNNNKLLQKLAFGDVTSNELFYHQNCYTTFKNEYRGKLREVDRQSVQEKNDNWKKASVMSKIISHIYETEAESPGFVFDAKTLETMYIELLELHNIQLTSHVTRFADKLVLEIEHLEKDGRSVYSLRIPLIVY